MVNDEIPSDTSKVTSTAHGRACMTHKQSLQWVNGKWKCLECTNTRPEDWKHPQSGGLTVTGGLGEKDKVEIVRNEFNRVDSVPLVPPPVTTTNQRPVEELLYIPQQALELFKSLAFDHLYVRLDQGQMKGLLKKLEDMPPPQKMSDAKAIIRLIEHLEENLKEK